MRTRRQRLVAMTAPTFGAIMVDALLADPHALDRLRRLVLASPSTPADAPAALSNGRMTPGMAAARAGVDARTVRRALDVGALRGEKHAGRWQIEPADFVFWRAIGSPTTATQTAPVGRARKGDKATRGADAIAGKPSAASR